MSSLCPITDCPVEATSLGLCRGHFAQVPVPIKAEIYQLVKRHKGGPAHMKAIRRACVAVNATLASWAAQHGEPVVRPARLPHAD